MPEGVVGLSHTQYSADADGSAPAGRVKRPIMRTAAHPLGMTRKAFSKIENLEQGQRQLADAVEALDRRIR
jgi:hypothetical protein